MTHRERLETAWNFHEPDRVPIEIQISPTCAAHPASAEVNELIAEHADNFLGAPGPGFGFLGLPTQYSETVIEDVPGSHSLQHRIHETAAGTFEALTYHPEGFASDYHWRTRFIRSLEHLEALANTPREPAPWNADDFIARDAEIGDSGYPIVGLLHPLGTLVRNATMEDVYAWFREEPKIVHAFLERSNAQIVATIQQMQSHYDGRLTFTSAAHEMLIPPWMGHELFTEFVRPYDAEVYGAIHQGGGRFRAHCHGMCGDFLETFAEIGVDSIEPLERHPTGDVDLAKAKRLVGDRMMLSGNIHSEHFMNITPEDVREDVRRTIGVGAPGGGFSLRTSGGYAGTSVDMDEATMVRVLDNIKEYIVAGLEYGQYPIARA
jgi:hypothetical protein